jgi:hypothetical protein
VLAGTGFPSMVVAGVDDILPLKEQVEPTAIGPALATPLMV